jgi:hypothetical protein
MAADAGEHEFIKLLDSQLLPASNVRRQYAGPQMHAIGTVNMPFVSLVLADSNK